MSQQRDNQMINTTHNLELKLSHAPTPPDSLEVPESPTSSTTSSSSAEPSSSSEMSIDGSCVSSEADDQDDDDQTMTSSPESEQIGRRGGVSPMVLVGCPRCLMYVMLSDANPKCPKCKSTVLLDFVNEGTNKKTGTT